MGSSSEDGGKNQWTTKRAAAGAAKIQEHAVWTPDDNSETTTALRLGLKRKSEDREEVWSGGGPQRKSAGRARGDETYLYRVGENAQQQQGMDVKCKRVEDGQLGRQTAAEGLSSVIGSSGQRTAV